VQKKGAILAPYDYNIAQTNVLLCNFDFTMDFEKRRVNPFKIKDIANYTKSKFCIIRRIKND
jgi:hypothetical protein